MVFLPDGGQLFLLIFVPITAGLVCGLSGTGLGVITQALYRLLSIILLLNIDDDISETSRRILAITTMLTLTQYPISAWQLFCSQHRHIRWDLVVFISPGLNLFLFLGTWLATLVGATEIILFVLGISFIVISLFQFVLQSILGRKVDDQKVISKTERKLRMLNGTPHPQLTAQSSMQSNSSQSDIPSAYLRHDDSEGTELDDLTPPPPTTTTTFNPSLYATPTLSDPVKNISLQDPYIGSDNYIVDLDNITNNDDGQSPETPSPMISPNPELSSIPESAPQRSSTSPSFSKPGIKTVWNQVASGVKTLSGIFGLLCGVVSGFLAGLFGINSPPIIAHFAHLKLNAKEIRDTFVVLSIIHVPFLLASRIIFNVFVLDEWLMYLIAVGTSTIGLFIGWYFHPYCDTRVITTVLQLVILLASIPLTQPGVDWEKPADVAFTIIYISIAIFLVGFGVWRVGRNRHLRQEVKDAFRQHNPASNTFELTRSSANML